MEHPHWQEAINFLSKKDKKLAKIISVHQNLRFICKEDAFQTLIRSVVGQQISVKAADSVWKMILQGVKKIHFKEFLDLNEQQTKDFGLSAQKSRYIKNIANYFASQSITNKSYWKKRSFEEISKELLEIKGIGLWTVQMFGIFYLLEPDIFPTKDLGLIRAIQNIYGKEKKLEILEIENLANQWKPWRSIATFFLWRSVDSNLVTY